jgi:hypothetical protein
MKYVYYRKGLVPTMQAYVAEAEDIDEDDGAGFAKRIDPVCAARLCTMSMRDLG